MKHRGRGTRSNNFNTRKSMITIIIAKIKDESVGKEHARIISIKEKSTITINIAKDEG